MYAAMSDSDKPHLCGGMMSEEKFAGVQHVIAQFIGAGIGVNRDNLTVIAGFDFRSNGGFIKSLTRPGMLFFG